MAKDEIDSKLAGRFAWGATPDLESEADVEVPASRLALKTPASDEAPEVEIAGRDTTELGSSDEKPAAVARRFVAPLADRVNAVWELAPEAQRPMMLDLLATAAEQPIYLVAMNPEAAGRLGRLAVRHRDSLTARARQAFLEISLWLPVEGREGAEYLLEIARSDDSLFRDGLALRNLGDELEVPEDFAARLAAIIEDGSLPWRARVAALGWVDLPLPAARVPGSPLARAVRGAIRARDLVARWLALASLRRSFPGVLDANDVVWLLEDAVLHPLPAWSTADMLDSALVYYPQELAHAVVAHPHPASFAALVRLALGECAGSYREFETINPQWALEALARTQPESAKPIIRRHLRAEWSNERSWGVAGAAALGAEAARPYLEIAARDGSAEVAEAARDAWRKLYNSPFPGDETAVIPEGLLTAPPSERLRGWLLALRGPTEARARIARVALDAAPDVEGLAALTVALADVWLFGVRQAHEGLPDKLAGWAAALLERFGAPGVEALVVLATRYGSGRYGWIYGIKELLERSDAAVLVSPDALERFADVAARYLVDGDGEADFSALGVLELARVRRPDLVDRLLDRALDPGARANHSAAAALLATAPVEAFRHELVLRLDAALERGDVARAGAVARVAACTDDELLLAATKRAVNHVAAQSWPHSAGVFSGFASAAQQLQKDQRLGPEWRRAALDNVDRAGFLLACLACPEPPRGRDLALLEAALQGAHPRAAAYAADALNRWNKLSSRSQAFTRALLGAPLIDQARLLNAGLCTRKAFMRAAWWPVVEALATSTDPDVARSVAEYPPVLLPWKRERARLEALVPRITVPAMREAFEIQLQLRPEKLYWENAAPARPTAQPRRRSR